MFFLLQSEHRRSLFIGAILSYILGNSLPLRSLPPRQACGSGEKLFYPAQGAFLPWYFSRNGDIPKAARTLPPAWGVQTDGFATLLVPPQVGGALWGLFRVWKKSETSA